jgi:hypothetical protein
VPEAAAELLRGELRERDGDRAPTDGGGTFAGDVRSSELRSATVLTFQKRVLERQIEHEKKAMDRMRARSTLGHSTLGHSTLGHSTLGHSTLGHSKQRQESDLLGCVFADRGIGDHFGYLRAAGIDPFPELELAWSEALQRYRGIFVLAPGPGYERNPIRREDPEHALEIHRAIAEEYARRHPLVIDVPWMSIEDRLEFVCSTVRSIGLSTRSDVSRDVAAELARGVRCPPRSPEDSDSGAPGVRSDRAGRGPARISPETSETFEASGSRIPASPSSAGSFELRTRGT